MKASRSETASGINPVFGPSAIAEIVQFVNPDALGLEPVSDRKFVARHGDGFRILEIPAFKGAAYGLRWGVAILAFWDETIDLPGILATAIHQNSLPASNFYLPNAGVVAALTAARMRDESMARHLASEAPTHDSDAELLHELIDQYLLQAR